MSRFRYRLAPLVLVALGLAAVAVFAIAGSRGPEGDTNSDTSRTTLAPATTPTAAPTSLSNSAPRQPNTAPPGSPAVASLFDRKVVQEAALQLKVEDVGSAFSAIGAIADGAGGIVDESSFRTERDHQIGTVTIRVPAEQFQPVMSQLRGLALEVVSESSSARDVTAEYTDLDSRLRNLEATEAQYLQLLAEASTVKDILLVQDRLNAVRGQIEETTGRIQLLENLSDLSTIRLELRPEAAFAGASDGSAADSIPHAAREAWGSSLDVLSAIATASVRVVVFLWWAPLLLAVAYLVRVGLTRRRTHESA